MNPLTAFFKLVSRLGPDIKILNSNNPKPGDVVKNMAKEIREELVNLKSDDIANVRVEDWWMTSSEYEAKYCQLEFEKKMGVLPPPRKKYE
jgi:hypothetical protein